MRSYSRHKLKEDKFAEATKVSVHWTVEHRKTVIIVAVAAGIVLAAVLGGWAYLSKRDAQASLALSEAYDALNAPVRAAALPVIPGVKSFASAKERADAAHKAFAEVAHTYGLTRSGKIANYMAGVAALEAGDAMGETHLKEAAAYRDKDLSSLARFALANHYRATNREQDAIALYKEVVAAQSSAVPSVTAQLELASLYEAKQPGEAAKIYEDIQKNNASSPYAQLAANKLEQLKQGK